MQHVTAVSSASQEISYAYKAIADETFSDVKYRSYLCTRLSGMGIRLQQIVLLQIRVFPFMHLLSKLRY